jgi:hypothetical protein
MKPVDSPLDVLTFVFAWLGYLSVTVAMLARFAGSARASRWAAPIMAGVASFHVFLVWAVRRGFDASHLSASGPELVPIILLYTLLALVLIHGVAHSRSKLAGRAVYPAWVLVTLMGMPSAFMIPEMPWLPIPMVATLVGGIAGLVVLRRRGAGSGKLGARASVAA